MIRVESLLSARLFLSPQLVGNRLYFISNLSGRLSLYVMDAGGSVPEPLLPPEIALQNPDLVGGYSYYVYPKLNKILLMLDREGDENYQPMLIPIDGGYPQPAFGDALSNDRVGCAHVDAKRNIAYLWAASHVAQQSTAYRADLATGVLDPMGTSRWGCYVAAANADHTCAILADGYTIGDDVLYQWNGPGTERELLFGKPLEMREPDEQVPLVAIQGCEFADGDRGLLLITALFDDSYGLAYLDLHRPSHLEPIAIEGAVHTGSGELTGLEKLGENRYQLSYNIDGCSWAYEGSFDEPARVLRLGAILCGTGELANGVMESIRYDEVSDRFVLAFSSATSPTQIYTVEGPDRRRIICHTRERVLGISDGLLSSGEDASFTSWDGLRISARLYLPARDLDFEGPRPLVYYIHGGPQSQERPDFAWFSMPLIQFLTLRGFAVFVPNVRGSTGYGLHYTKHVDRDWGGNDRLDHLHAMELLARDPRVDPARAGVVGRSYGGYMTLMLATRHPEFWKAAVDMFGPYDLIKFSERIPETWKPYFALALGDPVEDRDFLIERSPASYIHAIQCPLLVIQGKNDPRVVEQESREVVESLRAAGKQVEYLMFENEGHDVLKLENRVRCYNAIAGFFAEHLQA